MEKANSKKRDIRFYSNKNGAICLVHSDYAKKYALLLEKDENVKGYKACVPLEKQKYEHVAKIGLRKNYFDMDWATDFLLNYVDGRFGIREILTPSDNLLKRSTLEKLEFSRRYWTQQSAYDWKILLLKDGDV